MRQSASGSFGRRRLPRSVFCWKVFVIMARVARFTIVLASLLSLQNLAPQECHAGVIPWIYDAIFGPVGSMRPTYGYAPMTASYAPYGASYIPMTAAYAPVATAGYSSYGNSCSSCNQQASYAPSGCSSCESGNCSVGSSCSSCNANSTTAGYGTGVVGGPTPDPSSVSREENRKIYDLERKLEELDHRQKQDEKFLKRQHQDYIQEQFVPRTYQEEVPARPKKQTLESGTANPNNFETPINRGPAPGFDLKETEEETRKPAIELPPKTDSKTDDKGTTKVKEVEPQTFHRDHQATARAVAPRTRMQIVTNKAANGIAKLNKSPVTTSDASQSIQVANQAN